MKHIDWICSLESKLFFISICSIRTRSRNRDIVEKPQLISTYFSGVYVSYGGLLMRLQGEANSLTEIKIDQNVYLLLRKLSY